MMKAIRNDDEDDERSRRRMTTRAQTHMHALPNAALKAHQREAPLHTGTGTRCAE